MYCYPLQYIYYIVVGEKRGKDILDNVILLLYILLYIREDIIANKNEKAVDYVRPPFIVLM